MALKENLANNNYHMFFTHMKCKHIFIKFRNQNKHNFFIENSNVWMVEDHILNLKTAQNKINLPCNKNIQI